MVKFHERVTSINSIGRPQGFPWSNSCTDTEMEVLTLWGQRRYRSRSFFRHICFLVVIVIGIAGYAPSQSISAPELKKLYESHRWFALRDATKASPDSLFFQGAVDAAFNNLHSARKHLTAVITSSPHSADAYEAHELLAALYLRNGLYVEALVQLDSMRAEKPSADDVNNMRPLLAAFSSGGDQRLLERNVSTITMQRGTEGSFLPLTINGKEAAYAFDTGANFSMISGSEAERLGLRVRLVKTSIGDSSGGKIGLRTATAKDLWVGGLHLKNVAFGVLPDSQEPFKDLSEENRGLIGIPILLAMKEFQWEPSGKFILGVPAQSRHLPSSNLCFDEGFPVAQAWFQERPLELTLDSGAQQTVLGPAFSRDFAFLIATSGKRETHNLTGVAGSASYESVVLPSLTMRIGGYDVTLSPAHVLTKESSDTSSWAEGNLGIDLLEQAHTIIIDFNAMTLRLE